MVSISIRAPAAPIGDPDAGGTVPAFASASPERRAEIFGKAMQQASAEGGAPEVGMKHDGVWPGAAGDTSVGDVLLDIVNPLQHIPVVGSIYRSLTGDTQSATANIVGGGLFGGPLGLLGGVVSTLFDAVTGGGDAAATGSASASGKADDGAAA